MTAEMLKNGTATRSKKQIADELDKIKTDVYFYPSDGALNARINTDKANLDKALALVEDLLRNPKFDEAEFERMKVEYKARYEEGMSDPQTRVFERLQKLTNNYPKGHPLYTWSTDESLDELKKVKLEDLKSFYTNFYGANNSVSTFVGEIEKEKVETFLKNTLGKWNSKAAYAEIVPRHSETKGVNETINTPDKTNAVAAGGINLQVSEKDADYPALFMANELLGGGAFLNSRIAQRLRENEGMSYGAGSFFNTTYKHQSGIMGVYAFFNPIYKNRLDSALRQEIDKALTKGFMEDELKKSSSSLMEQRRTRLGSNEALSGMINNYLQDERNLDDFTKFEEAVKKLTVAEVNAAIRKHVDMGKMVLIYGGDFDKGKSKPASDKKVF
jgi:zinc protease